MKGIIIVPKYLEGFWTPKSDSAGLDFSTVLSANAPFYYAIRKAFGFELQYTDEIDVNSNTDIVLVFGIPYHNRPKLIPGLFNLNKNTKLVIFPGDIQCYNNRLCMENRIKIFEKCDLIIAAMYEYFVKIYPQFLYKYEFLPNSFVPHKRYTKFQFNEVPRMRCLLSGSLNKDVYPLRSLIVDKHCTNVDYKPPIYGGDVYAELLHSYFCCVTSSSIFNYVLSKYFEITAAGSLLLADETEDLKKVGFIPYHHYIPITKENVFTKITECLKNPSDYNIIRKQGMDFVRKNHSVINRIDSIKTIFKKLVA